MPNVCWTPGVRVKGSVFNSRIGGRVELPLPLQVGSAAPLPRGASFFKSRLRFMVAKPTSLIVSCAHLSFIFSTASALNPALKIKKECVKGVGFALQSELKKWTFGVIVLQPFFL